MENFEGKNVLVGKVRYSLDQKKTPNKNIELLCHHYQNNDLIVEQFIFVFHLIDQLNAADLHNYIDLNTFVIVDVNFLNISYLFQAIIKISFICATTSAYITSYLT